MYLVKSGVPFDVAFAAPDHWRLAMCVALGEFEGEKWSWRELRWLKKE
jgi:hypothetical protein